MAIFLNFIGNILGFIGYSLGIYWLYSWMLLVVFLDFIGYIHGFIDYTSQILTGSIILRLLLIIFVGQLICEPIDLEKNSTKAIISEVVKYRCHYLGLGILRCWSKLQMIVGRCTQAL